MCHDLLRPSGSDSGSFPEFGLSKRRREIIQRLEHVYSEDDLSLEDYEHRVHAAERATRIAELNALVADFSNEPSQVHPVRHDSAGEAQVRSALHPAVWIAPAALLILALLPFPYGYYVLLRLVVCGTAALLSYDEYGLRGRVSGWTMVLAGVALRFNIGLAYNQKIVSQDADAIDMWRRALSIDSGYARARRELDKVVPRLLELAATTRRTRETVLDRDHWYTAYFNPLELLGLDESTSPLMSMNAKFRREEVYRTEVASTEPIGTSFDALFRFDFLREMRLTVDFRTRVLVCFP